MRRTGYGFFIAVCLAHSLMAVSAASAHETIDLAGPWRLRLDAVDEGAKAGWPAAPLVTADSIVLPNTTDLAGFGFALDMKAMRYACPFPATDRFPQVAESSRADQRGYLVRQRLFIGPAWYEREVQIPEAWKESVVSLRIERAMWRTEAWVDGRFVRSCDSLVAEHRFDLGKLAPGGHRLTVRVDNRKIHSIATFTHAYGPETQSRWNGLIGAIRLQASPALAIRSMAVFPAEDRRSARVVLRLTNAGSDAVSGSIHARLFPERGEQSLADVESNFTCAPGLSTNDVLLRLADPAQPWDEFHPVRYRIEARVKSATDSLDAGSAVFGFRHIERVGKEIHLNGRPVFLRGTLDCAVYPKTGHPPMTVDAWERVLGVVKQYGFNHVRFHTWCPPNAAFEAADRLGVYLQPETPAWVDDWTMNTDSHPKGIGHDPDVVEYLRAEMRRIGEEYGNHPSFVMLTIGNEFGLEGTDWDCVGAMVAENKRLDPRRLYSGCTARRHMGADDYWVTHDDGAATRGVGPAQTDWDFAKAVAVSPVPVIAHETGQRPVFPDYDALLPKFTGPLLPLNLDCFRRMLAASGMADQLQDFVRASAKFQIIQYKAEHEAMLRTRGFAGYQLLMLNDFTGQSEALVGVLDPFWEPKGVVGADDVRAWNAPTVVLARFPKFVWTSDETFHAQIEVAHFGQRDLDKVPLKWTLAARGGEVASHAERVVDKVPVGGITALDEISVSLKGFQAPTALTLTVRLAETENHWNLWVYPAGPDEPEPAGVLVTKTLDNAALQSLRGGGKVLWLAHGLKNAHAATTGFESVYWTAAWSHDKFASLGVLCDPKHPALAEFPSDGCSDWQWRNLCAGATTLLLQDAPPGFRPIVQPVPDFHYCPLLAHVFEAKVGSGSLLVCGYDLTSNLDRRLAARQFRRSLFRYAASAVFRPKQQLTPEELLRLVNQ